MLTAILLEWKGDSKFSYDYDLNKFENQIGKLILKGRKYYSSSDKIRT